MFPDRIDCAERAPSTPYASNPAGCCEITTATNLDRDILSSGVRTDQLWRDCRRCWGCGVLHSSSYRGRVVVQEKTYKGETGSTESGFASVDYTTCR